MDAYIHKVYRFWALWYMGRAQQAYLETGETETGVMDYAFRDGEYNIIQVDFHIGDESYVCIQPDTNPTRATHSIQEWMIGHRLAQDVAEWKDQTHGAAMHLTFNGAQHHRLTLERFVEEEGYTVHTDCLNNNVFMFCHNTALPPLYIVDGIAESSRMLALFLWKCRQYFGDQMSPVRRAKVTSILTWIEAAEMDFPQPHIT